MTDSTAPDDEALRSKRSTAGYGDAVIDAALAATFAAAFVNAKQWEAIAAHFPLAVAGSGIALCAVFLGRCIVTLRRSGKGATPSSRTVDAAADARPTDDATPSQSDSDRAFFASVSVRDWLVSLAYFFAFFIALYVFGLYPTSIFFSVIYLRFQARSSWPLSVIYAAGMAGALYALFGVALKLPVPQGLIGLS
jgi:Tripartite tricarboxylate transporter TctB family